MTGTLKIKNDTYYAVLNTKEDGKYKQKWISTRLKTKGNKRKATEILNELIAKYEKQQFANPDDILFCDYMMKWLSKKKNTIEQITYEGYEGQINAHIFPYFSRKRLKLSEIKPSHIAEYYEKKIKNGRCDGKGGLSYRSIQIQSFIIKSILNEATFHEIISHNPALKIPLPKKETARRGTSHKEVSLSAF